MLNVSNKNIFLILLIWTQALFNGSAQEFSHEISKHSQQLSGKITFSELLADSPQNLQFVIKEGLKSVCDCSSYPIDTISFSPLSGGFTSSKLYMFSVHDNPYVIKILDPKRLNDPMPTRDKRMREILAQQAASKLALAPEVMYFDPNGLILIMRYIDGHTLSAEDLEAKNFLLLLGASLKSYHQLKIQLPEKRTQLARAEKHNERAKLKGIAFPSNFKALYESFVNEESLVDKEVLCHGDLHPSNILVQNGVPLFIDFAGATYDHSFTDIGYLTLLSGMTSQQSAFFLEGYFGRPATKDEYKMMELAQARTCFLTALVWFDFSESLEDCKKPIQERVAHLDQLLASLTLKTGNEYILERKTVNPTTAPAQEIQKFALGFLKEYLLRMDQLVDNKKDYQD